MIYIMFLNRGGLEAQGIPAIFLVGPKDIDFVQGVQ